MLKTTRKRLISLSLILSSSIGCDQTTKRIAEQTLNETSHSFFFDTIRLQFIKNSGAFLGFGSDFSENVKLWFFLIVPIVLLTSTFIYLIISPRIESTTRLMIALIISGGGGNLIDRFLQSGRVTDFINLGVGPLRTGIFNVADVAIMIGALGLLIIEIRRYCRSKASPISP